jgi:transmembrane sensor
MISEVSMKRAISAWTQRHSGTWRDADETELQAWLVADAEHREAYEKVARAWTTAGALQGHPAIERLREYDNAAFKSGAQISRSLLAKLAIAACIALLSVALGVSLWPAASRWWNGPEIRLTTLKGQPRPFTLDDGTQVLLDADSELVARIGHHSRRVSLIHGEALLTVVHDSSRPLELTLGAGRIQDLGTRFDVEYLSDSSRIAVLEGRVAVLTPRGRALLVAGQSSGYDSAGNLQPVSPLDPAATRWSQGERHFDREPLGDVLERLARYHPVTFVFAASHLRNLRVSGTFRTGDQDLFLRTLAAALPIEVKYLTPERIEISARTPDNRMGDSH